MSLQRRGKNLSVKLKFHTGVGHLGAVDGLGGPPGSRVELGRSQNVRAVFAVEVECTGETVAKESEVNTGIPSGGLFPTELVVRGCVKGALQIAELVSGHACGKIG